MTCEKISQHASKMAHVASGEMIIPAELLTDELIEELQEVLGDDLVQRHF